MTRELPKLDFTTFILSVSSAALMSLGEDFTTDEQSLESKIDLGLARQNIELLELLHEKTKGNRTEEEDQLLEKLLFEVRMRYLDTEKKSKSK